MQPQLGPAAPLDPVEASRRQRFAQVDDFAIANAMAVAKAVVARARKGDKTCMELYYKYLANPLRQELQERKRDTSKAMPPLIKIELFFQQRRLGNAGGPLKLTQGEFDNLSPYNQERVKNYCEIVPVLPADVVAPAAPEPVSLASEAGSGSAAVPPSRKPANAHNFVCQKCGASGYSSHPAQVKFCKACRDEKARQKLQRVAGKPIQKVEVR